MTRSILRRLRMAAKAVEAEISGNWRSGGLHSRGLSGEGYAGGYRDALADVHAMLTHGHPTDSRGYWRVSPEPRNTQTLSDGAGNGTASTTEGG